MPKGEELELELEREVELELYIYSYSKRRGNTRIRSIYSDKGRARD